MNTGAESMVVNDVHAFHQVAFSSVNNLSNGEK